MMLKTITNTTTTGTNCTGEKSWEDPGDVTKWTSRESEDELRVRWMEREGTTKFWMQTLTNQKEVKEELRRGWQPGMMKDE